MIKEKLTEQLYYWMDDDLDEPKYVLYNKTQGENIGVIEKIRVGRFMHWCLIPYEDTFFSNGCLKAISKFITTLYTGKVTE